MKRKVEYFVESFSDFHKLSSSNQIIRLVYFHTIVESRQTISKKELERLFAFASLPVPNHLPQLLAYLCGKGKKLIREGDEYKLRREVIKEIRQELRQLSGAPKEPETIAEGPFVFASRVFKDRKVETLVKEAAVCYERACWNACGILMRIVLERTLDSVDPTIKEKQGLKAKLNYAAGTQALFSRSVRESLEHLQGAKIIGDIAAHHSNIILEKADIDITSPHFRMLIKEVDSI